MAKETQMEAPSNISELRWFLGMVNHMGKYLPTQPSSDQ